MPQFDVYKHAIDATTHALLLDIQSDLIGIIDTRVVVPLVPASRAPSAASRLNPTISVNSRNYVALFQDIQSVSTDTLGARVGNVGKHGYDVTVALDFLFQGY